MGKVTCKILDELAHSRPWQTPSAARGLQPLARLVCPSSHCPEVQPLLDQLLGSWSFVETQQEALSLRKAARDNRQPIGNIVTRYGYK